MEEDISNEQSLKELAKEALVRSVDSVSNDREIIQKIENKILFVQETNEINVIYKTNSLQEKIGLYLIAKFVGHKILEIFDKPTAGSSEISSKLNLSINALAPALGALSKEFIEKENEEYKIKAYKILDFLGELDMAPKIVKNNVKKKINKDTQETLESRLILKKNGFSTLSSVFDIGENDLRKMFFVRENDVRIIDYKFLDNDSPKQLQLDASLMYLVLYKYFFGLEKVPSSLLRKKLRLMGIKSLSNLTTNLHKFPEFIIHDAGKRGSTNNDFIITDPGEGRIKGILKRYISALEIKENG